jgi:hypothetical protein
MNNLERSVLAELQRRYNPRQSTEGLLNFLGALELAFCSGVLREVPENVKRLTRLLTNMRVRDRQRELGSWLPDSLHDRWGGNSAVTVATDIGTELFNDFLWIDALIRDEPAVRTFVAIVDPKIELPHKISPREIKRFRLMIRASSVPRIFHLHPQRRSGTAEHAVIGFGEFLDFCIELDGLLQSCANVPILQTRYFGFYAPYFGASNKPILKDTKSMLERLVGRSRMSHDPYSSNETTQDLAWLALDALTRFERGDYLRTRDVLTTGQ